MGRCRRRISSALTSCSLARIRFEIGDPLELETPAPGLPADVREAQEVERLRLPEATRLPSLGGEPPELDQPRLVGVQLQAELREPLAKISEEPLGVLTMLEADDEVVSEAHDDHVTVRVAPSPLVGPQVKDVVQVDVCEQRRNRCPLRRSLQRL